MYLDTKIGMISFTACMPITVIIISSLDIPASINFKFDAASVPENPNYYNISHNMMLISHNVLLNTKVYKKHHNILMQRIFTLAVSSAIANSFILGLFIISHNSL